MSSGVSRAHSFSTSAATVTHSVLDLVADFERRTLEGSIQIVVAVSAGATAVVLDTNHLEIRAVRTCVGPTWSAAEGAVTVAGDEDVDVAGWTLAEAVEPFGRALSIPLAGAAAIQRFVIDYATTSEGGAIQWLDAAQTSDKVHPFLFTQCQAIHARSLFPCQDTPQVKSSYAAVITAPTPLRPVLSARNNGAAALSAVPPAFANAARATSASSAVASYWFEQPVPCASYLVAIAIGRVEHFAYDERCGVWAEPSVLDAAKFEFDETPEMLRVGESICGPYEWGRYDVLCMPSSFPYGGMENPCLTFVTPSLLAGDKSLADVVIHEITHSWTGNLVTNRYVRNSYVPNLLTYCTTVLCAYFLTHSLTYRTWEHFWLNEGWTTHVQRKIVREIRGLAAAELDSLNGQIALSGSVERYGAAHPFTKMVPPLAGIDPDDAFSSIPYEKGCTFLAYLESVVGGHEVWMPFVKAYIQHFRTSTLVSSDLQDLFTAHFPDAAAQVDWETWLHAPGMPDPALTEPVFAAMVSGKAELARITTLVDRWVAFASAAAAAGGDGAATTWTAEAGETEGFDSLMWQQFLDEMQKAANAAALGIAPAGEAPASSCHGVLATMDAACGFSAQRNAEIRFRWIVLCIRAALPSIEPAAHAFLAEYGRMKFVRPLFRELKKQPIFKDGALALFQRTRLAYHPICAKMVAKDLGAEV